MREFAFLCTRCTRDKQATSLIQSSSPHDFPVKGVQWSCVLPQLLGAKAITASSPRLFPHTPSQAGRYVMLFHLLRKSKFAQFGLSRQAMTAKAQQYCRTRFSQHDAICFVL